MFIFLCLYIGLYPKVITHPPRNSFLDEYCDVVFGDFFVYKWYYLFFEK